MATGNLVKDFSDEATCSLCLEHFKDPVTVDCGHNFCQACITQCLGKVEAEPSCPQCRETISQRNFRPNRQLANLVELIKKFQQEKQEEEKRGVCREHQEPLKFFCKDDRMCICALCYQFKGHKGHNVFYLEEASEEFKEKIKNQIPSLVKKRKELEALNSDEEQKMQKSLAHLEKEKEKIMSAFEELQTVLELNRCAWLSLLEDLEEKVKEIREENSAELLSEVTSLNSQIAEIEKKCQQPADELLQDIADGLDVYDSAEARKPVLKPWTLEANLRLWTQRREALETIVQDSKDSLEKSLLRGSLEASLEKVIVTLDPDTAHPFLFVSEDRSSVTRGDSSQILPFKRERFDIMPCVLGCEKFTTGRHYWHVEIEGNGATWTIGVARESVKRKDRINFGPEEGIWAIQSHFCPGFSQQTGYQVSALTSPSQIIISPSWQLSKIRVSLDYEEGCVAFFDACSGRSIFTFSSASFARERVCPFFRLSPGTTLNCC